MDFGEHCGLLTLFILLHPSLLFFLLGTIWLKPVVVICFWAGRSLAKDLEDPIRQSHVDLCRSGARQDPSHPCSPWLCIPWSTMVHHGPPVKLRGSDVQIDPYQVHAISGAVYLALGPRSCTWDAARNGETVSIAPFAPLLIPQVDRRCSSAGYLNGGSHESQWD